MLSLPPEYESLLIDAAMMPVIFLVLMGIGRWLKRRQGVRLGTFYVLFAICVAVWLPHVITHSGYAWRVNADREIRAVTLLFGTFFALALVRRYFWEGWFERRYGTRAPKFLTEIAALFIVLAALAAVLTLIYEKDISALAVSSTIVVGVIGLAMQDLLGNVIAGVALEIGKPFKTGDWLVVEGRHAEVMEVNWRSTRLRTNDHIYLDIPNKAIVGSAITNLTFPTAQHALRMTVGFDYAVQPNFIKDIVAQATAGVRGVLATPRPKVFLKDFGEFAVLYEIKFWIEDEGRYNDIVDGIRTNVWYAAQRNGVRIQLPVRTIEIGRAAAKQQDAVSAARASVQRQPFLQLLDGGQVDRLLANAQFLRYGRGEKVIEQGAEGASMFILLSGEAEVYVHGRAQESLVATLRCGDYFGEMSLLTGEPRSATVIARTDCEMWEIGKEVIAELLQENAALVQKLGELLARRRIETEGVLASTAAHEERDAMQKKYTASFLRKLSSFFGL